MGKTAGVLRKTYIKVRVVQGQSHRLLNKVCSPIDLFTILTTLDSSKRSNFKLKSGLTLDQRTSLIQDEDEDIDLFLIEEQKAKQDMAMNPQQNPISELRSQNSETRKGRLFQGFCLWVFMYHYGYRLHARCETEEKDYTVQWSGGS